MRIEGTVWLKALYCLTLLGMIFPSALYGASGWVGPATGGGMLAAIGLGGLVVTLALVLYRVFTVVRVGASLDAFVHSVIIRGLRIIGILCMLAGLLGSLAIFFVKPIALALFGQPGDAGIAFFVTGLYAYGISQFSLPGILLFEFSRLLGFEQHMQAERSRRASQPAP